MYREEVLPNLKKDLGVQNTMAVPRIQKVVVNVGIGSIVARGGKDFDHVRENIAKITGQKPVVNLAKKAVSNFKLRIGMPVGVSVTLRGERMLQFLDRLVNTALPRVRDFRGISPKAFDGQGNYSLGFKEVSVFPEATTDDLSKLHGVQICITTTASDRVSGEALLRACGFPFKK